MNTNHGIIRTIYLYLFALVGLFILVFSSVNFVGAVLDRYVFPQEYVDYSAPVPVDGMSKPVTPAMSDEEKRANFKTQQTNDFKRRVNQSIPGVIIGFFLWRFHWLWIIRDRQN